MMLFKPNDKPLEITEGSITKSFSSYIVAHEPILAVLSRTVYIHLRGILFVSCRDIKRSRSPAHNSFRMLAATECHGTTCYK